VSKPTPHASSGEGGKEGRPRTAHPKIGGTENQSPKENKELVVRRGGGGVAKFRGSRAKKNDANVIREPGKVDAAAQKETRPAWVGEKALEIKGVVQPRKSAWTRKARPRHKGKND